MCFELFFDNCELRSLPHARHQHRQFQIDSRLRFADEIALDLVAAVMANQVQLFLHFHAFGNDGDAQAVRQRNNTGNES